MLGRYSRFLMRLLSVGHLFLINVIYATAVLINALACLWCVAVHSHAAPAARTRAGMCKGVRGSLLQARALLLALVRHHRVRP